MKQYLSSLIILILLSTQSAAIIESFQHNTQQNEVIMQQFFNPISSQSISLQTKTLSEHTIHIQQPYYHNKTTTISTEDLSIHRHDHQRYTLSLSDSIPANQPDLPLIPMRTIIFSLPLQATIHDISFVNYSIQKSTLPITFTQTPKPTFWSINTTPLQQHTEEILQETKRKYDNQSIYPGTTHTYISGKNNTNTTIILYYYPIQYNLKTKETYFIKQGTFSVSYSLIEESSVQTPKLDDDAEHIIITPPRFYPQAQSLKRFHNDQGIATSIITTTTIKLRCKPSEYPSVMGYKDFKFRQKISEYDDILARKIITYLNQQSTNMNLRYVTLLGNAKHVPPSYYFGYDYYPVPTDFYYSSPDLDLIPNYCIGRLPANTFLEARQMIHKMKAWNPSETQMQHVAVAGGIPFNTDFLIGEMITIDSVNQGLFNGYTVDKYYRTDSTFDKEDILSALEMEYGLFYMICHGSPFLIAVEEGLISGKDIRRYTENKNAPIISCIACSSGSYDTHIIKQGMKLDKRSFGENVLLSNGGGIAYIGGSRTNNGYPIFSLNHGRVKIEKETYMAGLLTTINKAYRLNKNYLGELTTYAAETYLKDNDMNDFWNLYHYFSYVLLGDPALKLPDRNPSDTSYSQPESSAKNPVGYEYVESDYGDYQGTYVLNAIQEQNNYEIHSDSSKIYLKKIETDNTRNLDITTTEHNILNGNTTIPILHNAKNLTLLRFITEDGKEDWLYIRPVRPVNDDYTNSTPGFQQTRWNTIQSAIDAVDEHDPIYVFNGTYKETIIINKPCKIKGENTASTIIDGQGYGDVIQIQSNDVSLSGFTIEHCGKEPSNAAIAIEPKMTWKPEQIIIQENRIINNKNCGIYINNNKKIKTPSITILNNDISYNNYGVYIQQEIQGLLLKGNTIFSNNYGVYDISSKDTVIEFNTIENNRIGFHLQTVRNVDVNNNNFVQNTQHCQFMETKNTKFKQNYWDNWIGHLFKKEIRLPKIINGIIDPSQDILSQIKIDMHPIKTIVDINSH